MKNCTIMALTTDCIFFDTPDRPAFHQSANFSPDERGSIIMQDWTMVAAGLERMFFLVYALAFAVVTSVYV